MTKKANFHNYVSSKVEFCLLDGWDDGELSGVGLKVIDGAVHIVLMELDDLTEFIL